MTLLKAVAWVVFLAAFAWVLLVLMNPNRGVPDSGCAELATLHPCP